MSSLRTDPALAARHRPLKPLLAQVLAGEPWLAALCDPRDTTPTVAAACIFSYISRRHSTWETILIAGLEGYIRIDFASLSYRQLL